MGNVTEIRAAAAIRRVKVDQYGELERRLALAAPDEEQFALLKKEIQAWHGNDPGEAPQVETGNVYRINLSAARNERTVTDKEKAWKLLRKAMGSIEALLAAIEIPLGLIDKHVPKSLQKQFMSEERSGYRTLDVVALQPAAGGDFRETA